MEHKPIQDRVGRTGKGGKGKGWTTGKRRRKWERRKLEEEKGEVWSREIKEQGER